MPRSRRLTTPVSLVVGLVATALLVVPGVAVGQSPTTAGGGDVAEFPLPVVAPVLPPAEASLPLAVTSFGVAGTDAGDDTGDADAIGGSVEVRYAETFELPDAFRYRVDLRIGRPGETGPTQSRVSFVVEDGGAPRGRVEIGNGSGWDETGEVEVSFADGVLTLGLPADLDLEAEDLAWLDISLVEEEGNAAERFLTPLVPAAQVLTPGGPALSAATWAWGSVDQQPPAEPLELGLSPLLSLEGDEVVIEYQESIPEVVEGQSVVKVLDVVRVAPDFADGGAAPYLVVVNHELGTLSLLDGTLPGLPAIPTDDAWVLTGLPARPVGALDEIRFSLPAVLEAFGIEAADLATDGAVALGIARSAEVRSGVDEPFPVRSDGVLATTAWLTTAAVAATAPASVAEAPDADEVAAPVPEEEGEGVVVFVAIGCLVALLGTAAFLVVRWLEHRRRVMASGPVIPTGPAPEPSDAEREELAEFTRQLFDNRR